MKAVFWSLFCASLVLWFVAGAFAVSPNSSLSNASPVEWIAAGLAASLTQAWVLIAAGYLFGLGFFAARGQQERDHA